MTDLERLAEILWKVGGDQLDSIQHASDKRASSAVAHGFLNLAKAIRADFERAPLAAGEQEKADPAKITAALAGLIAALKKGGTLSTESAGTRSFPKARKLVIGFESPDDADEAMQAVAAALTKGQVDAG